jgi:hypothetical protein
MTHLIHARTREVTRSRLYSVPNFILAFIPAQIDRDTLNTMTAFAVRVCAQHLGPIRNGLIVCLDWWITLRRLSAPRTTFLSWRTSRRCRAFRNGRGEA